MMAYDKSTKIILVLIACGLWANILTPLLAPVKAHADSESVLSDILSKLDSMEYDIGRIQRGTCTNGKLC